MRRTYAKIRKKFEKGYPRGNIVFEDTRRAVLIQDGRERNRFELADPRKVADPLNDFYDYAEPNIEGFEQAVREFKGRVPELARGLDAKIKLAHKENAPFQAAFDDFFAVCQTALNPNLSRDAVDEMLVQHLLTERLFRRGTWQAWPSPPAAAGPDRRMPRGRASGRLPTLPRPPRRERSGRAIPNRDPTPADRTPLPGAYRPLRRMRPTRAVHRQCAGHVPRRARVAGDGDARGGALPAAGDRLVHGSHSRTQPLPAGRGVAGSVAAAAGRVRRTPAGLGASAPPDAGVRTVGEAFVEARRTVVCVRERSVHRGDHLEGGASHSGRRW